MLLGSLADVAYVAVEVDGIVGNGDGVGGGRVAILVVADDVDEVVAGIALHEHLLRRVGCHLVGRVSIEGIDDALLLQPVHGEAPQGLILLCGAVALSPPEP